MGYGSYFNSPYTSGFSPSSYGYHNSTLNVIPSGARGPFETVESFVHAISSISMMLESTYSALIASVRSVFAVGEQLSRMKSQMGHLYAALAFTRIVRWLKDRFGWVLGRKATPDLIWTNVVEDADRPKSSPSQWPLLLYMGFLIGAPYLTWRLVKSTDSDQQDTQKWMNGEADHFVAKALFDFDSTRSDELSFQSGDQLKIAPTDLQTSGNRGWLLATVDGAQSGLVPANRIKILGKKTTELKNQ